MVKGSSGEHKFYNIAFVYCRHWLHRDADPVVDPPLYPGVPAPQRQQAELLPQLRRHADHFLDLHRRRDGTHPRGLGLLQDRMSGYQVIDGCFLICTRPIF